MFNHEPNKTSLIIVCDDKTKEYASFLQQLISQNDDYDDTIVGVKDGTVSAAIWSTKVYEDNLAELTSNSYVVFIGSSEISKEQGRNVKFSFCKYGMNYGWLGKRAGSPRNIFKGIPGTGRGCRCQRRHGGIYQIWCYLVRR